MSATGACLAGLARAARSASAPVTTPSGFFVNVRDFGAKGDGKADDTMALQRAIDHIRGRADALGDTSYLPCIVLPAGHYRLTDTIYTVPWIKLRSEGSVLLDFTQLPVDRDGIVCRNEVSIPGGALCFAGNRSPFLDGTGGTVSILGPGGERSDGWGIVIGDNDPHAPGAVRDTGGCYVVVTGWRGALCIDPVHTYLTAWRSCRFEQNRDAAIYVRGRAGAAIDSGERMTFLDCTFAGSQHAVSIDADSQDFVFDACSFDFHGDVLYFGPRASYGTVALSHCHIEGIDGQLVNAVESGTRLRVAINHSIVLPRPWKRKTIENSPRRLVSGRVRFGAIAVEFRFEQSPDKLHDPLIGDEVVIESLGALSFPGVDALPARQLCLNADAHFAADAPGTSADALAHWKAPARSVARASVHRAGAVQALVVMAPLAGGADFALTSRSPFSVEVGATIVASCVVAANGKPPRIAIQLEFLTSDARRLELKSSPSMRDALLPLRATVPPGASYALLHASFSDWSGELQVLRLAAWRTT
ncbi:Pectate lyase superfamily protein [Paraburkholderia diazotrophica]|uniref:Pectate lyase superfamily protein n=1 Tax=Paraburkholderia diazotrophica TaxID=667676 RepID=A0A1H7DZW3_9BURK|nr:Pectate lyase superfamily protein [Paraburkholderia diazotrophica]